MTAHDAVEVILAKRDRHELTDSQIDDVVAYFRDLDPVMSSLADSLRDLSWLPGNGYALLFEDAGPLREHARADFDTLLDVLQEASASWAEDGVPFWAFLALPDAGAAEAGPGA